MAPPPHVPDEGGNNRLMRAVATGAVATAAGLAILKAGAFFTTNSMAILASLADSGLDIIASFVNLLAIRRSLTPADADHRFGHGKAEPLAGLAQGAFLAGSAVFLIFGAVERLIDPQPISRGGIGLFVMVVSIVATAVLVCVQKWAVQRTGSLAIGADRLHYASDLLTNIGVIVGIVLSTKFAIHEADPVIGIAVAIILAYGAFKVFRQSYDQLMDRELPEVSRALIKSVAMRHPAVRGWHDLRTRAAGTRSFIQIHLELDWNQSFLEAHVIGREVESALRDAFPGAEILVHLDPAGDVPEGDLAKT